MSDETRISKELVHQVCPYLRQSLDCKKCSRTVQSPYGPGTQGCFALAEEVIEIVSRELAETRREGWVMVPRKPTEAICRAGEMWMKDGSKMSRLQYAAYCWTDMLAAVEKP